MTAVKRVAVVGPCGAGKSHLSLRLGAITGLPVFHIDRMFWKPGWVRRTGAELAERLRPVVARDAWIVDGNYSSTMPMRFALADTVVFVDMPRRVYLGRVLRRMMLARWLERPDLAEGCRERLDLDFLAFVWRFDRESRPRVLEHLRQRRTDSTLVWLRSARETERFVESVRRGVEARATGAR